VLSNTALSLTVPVVWSIWLSMVSNFPEAKLVFISRLYAKTGKVWPSAVLLVTSGRLSSGRLKMTAIGCTCVITASGFVSLV
jgi:hypothetical protein